ncbi:MAG: type II toxin-antitoxin system mRNA interferase toxin, RelE/StbE family [Burkholderiales bacterium]
MALEIIIANSFKKDLKKYKHKNVVLNELQIVVDLLANEKTLPAKYKNHFLIGSFRKYKDVQELHLRPDDLLVYFKIESQSITLVAIGNHADLFG